MKLLMLNEGKDLIFQIAQRPCSTLNKRCECATVLLEYCASELLLLLLLLLLF